MRKLSILVTAVALFACVGVARGTTGALELVHPPNVTVPYARAIQFEGRYVLAGVGSGADISSGGMKIGFSIGTVPQYLIGAAQLYQYDDAGRLETALFTLFPFRATATGVSASILKRGIGGPDRTSPQGRLILEKPRGPKRLEGEIELHGEGPFRVVFTRLAPTAKYEGKSPPAKQLREAGDGAATAAGWGRDPHEYEGEYELTDPAPEAGGGGGIFAPLISLAAHLGPDGAEPTGGDLTVLRGEPPIAEVNLELGSFHRTVFLTDLSRRGALRVATVRDASPTGPKVGSFQAKDRGGLLAGTLTAGEWRYPVRFERER